MGLFFVPSFFLLHGQSFEHQSTLTQPRFQLLFSNSSIHHISRINSVRLNPSLRTEKWSARVPLGAGIVQNNSKAFFMTYLGFFQQELHEIENDQFKFLSDLAVDKEGRLLLCDLKGNALYYYQINIPEKKLQLQHRYKVTQPFRCEMDRYSTVYSLSTKKKLIIYRLKENDYVRNKNLERYINTQLTSTDLIDLTITKQGDIVILTKKLLYKFNLNGELIKTKILNKPYIAVENTLYGDILLLNADDKMLEKYTQNFEKLTAFYLEEFSHHSPMDMTVYDSFGYVAITGGDFGAYYGMGVDVLNPILNPDINQDVNQEMNDIKNKDKRSEVAFTITFPSKAKLYIKEYPLMTKTILYSNDLLMSGRHSMTLPTYYSRLLTDKQAELWIEIEALYSIKNKVERSVAPIK